MARTVPVLLSKLEDLAEKSADNSVVLKAIDASLQQLTTLVQHVNAKRRFGKVDVAGLSLLCEKVHSLANQRLAALKKSLPMDIVEEFVANPLVSKGARKAYMSQVREKRSAQIRGLAAFLRERVPEELKERIDAFLHGFSLPDSDSPKEMRANIIKARGDLASILKDAGEESLRAIKDDDEYRKLPKPPLFRYLLDIGLHLNLIESAKALVITDPLDRAARDLLEKTISMLISIDPYLGVRVLEELGIDIGESKQNLTLLCVSGLIRNEHDYERALEIAEGSGNSRIIAGAKFNLVVEFSSLRRYKEAAKLLFELEKLDETRAREALESWCRRLAGDSWWPEYHESSTFTDTFIWLLEFIAHRSGADALSIIETHIEKGQKSKALIEVAIRLREKGDIAKAREIALSEDDSPRRSRALRCIDFVDEWWSVKGRSMRPITYPSSIFNSD